MNTKLATLALFAVAALAFVGCEKKEPEPVAPPPPPPKSASVIANELKNSVAILWRPYQSGGASLTDADRQQAVSSVTSALGSARRELHGTEGIGIFRGEVTDLIKTARDDTRWNLVLGAIMVYEAIEPGEERYGRLKQRAIDIINRPEVKSRGFVETDGNLIAQVDVKDKQTGMMKTYWVSEGELFHNDEVKLVRIIGNQSGLELEYMKTNDTWQIKGPKEKR